jgi:hypothetical protein
MLLKNGSPALDIIPAAASLCSDATVDQRGVSRPQNGTCDAGSVEVLPATLQLSPSSLDFGYTPLSQSPSRTATVTNLGELDLPAPSLHTRGPYSATGCGSPVSEEQSCTITIVFDPTTGGSFPGRLDVRSGTLRRSATLQGIGWAPTVPPAIPGTPSVGYKTGVGTGRWPAPPTGFTFQWRRCDASGNGCSDIAGKTRASYRPVLADAGHTLRVVLTATSPTAVESDPVTTAASPVVTRTVPTVLQAPRIPQSSAPVVGTRLTGDHGEWTGAPDSYGYQWLRCDGGGANCVSIAGATSNRYKPTADDVGSTLRADVTATNPAGTGGPARTASTGVVQAT